MPATAIYEARMRASMFYRIAAVLLLLFDAAHTSGFPWSDPKWEWVLAPCGQLTFTLWGLAGLIGIFMLGSDSLSACFFYSRWNWRGS